MKELSVSQAQKQFTSLLSELELVQQPRSKRENNKITNILKTISYNNYLYHKFMGCCTSTTLLK